MPFVQIQMLKEHAHTKDEMARRVADAISKVPGVVDILNGVEDAISGPAVTFQINPFSAARAGFTPEEVSVDASAILEGEPAAAKNHRTASAPRQSSTAIGSTTLPSCLDIARPWASTTCPRQTAFSYAGRPKTSVPTAMSE